MRVSLIVAGLLLGSSWLLAQDDKPPADAPPTLFPGGYLDHDALGAALRHAADEHPKTLAVRSIAKSGQGRDVWMASISKGPIDAKNPKPAILIAANLEADHLVGAQVALGLVEKLAGDDPAASAILDRCTVYIVPRLNPDGAARTLATPRTDTRTNLTAVDRDRDGKQGEDGPDDLDGDGVIVRMRVKDAKASMIVDPKEPRLLKKADATKGEKPVYSEYAEGKDDDDDGKLNEDPAGGVNLNRNWPHRWTEFDPEAGYGPASEPEVRALIQFAYDHPEIVAVWSFALNDNIKAEPKKAAGGLDDSDLALVVELSKQYAKRTSAEPAKAYEPPKDTTPKEAAKPDVGEPAKIDRARLLEQVDRFTNATPEERAKMAGQLKGQRGAGGGGRGQRPGGAPAAAAPAPVVEVAGLDATTDGAMAEWAYHQLGVVGLSSRLWALPDVPAGSPTEGDARWLAWNDKVMGGRAFAAYKEFDHPTLGKVEVGGWRPGVRLNPPIEALPKLVDAQFGFLGDLSAKLPTLAITDVKVEARGGGVFEVKATVANEGTLPTALAAGVRTRKAPPVVVRLRPGDAKVIGGKVLNRVDALAGSGGKQEYRWLLLSTAGEPVSLEASSPKAGRVVKSIELR